MVWCTVCNTCPSCIGRYSGNDRSFSGGRIKNHRLNGSYSNVMTLYVEIVAFNHESKKLGSPAIIGCTPVSFADLTNALHVTKDWCRYLRTRWWRYPLRQICPTCEVTSPAAGEPSRGHLFGWILTQPVVGQAVLFFANTEFFSGTLLKTVRAGLSCERLSSWELSVSSPSTPSWRQDHPHCFRY